jgi:hypothetical protein
MKDRLLDAGADVNAMQQKHRTGSDCIIRWQILTALLKFPVSSRPYEAYPHEACLLLGHAIMLHVTIQYAAHAHV